MPAPGTVDIALHPFDDTRFLSLGDVGGDVDLPGRALVFVTQTTSPLATVQTVLFIGLKLYEQVMSDARSPGFQPHGITRGAAAPLPFAVDTVFLLGEALFIFSLVALG